MQIKLNEVTHALAYSEYHNAEGLRSGWLNDLRRSPLHLKTKLDNPKPATPAMLLGQLIHQALENPERFADLAVVEPEFVGKTKDGRDSAQSGEARKMRAEWRAARRPEEIVVTKDDFDTVIGIIRSLNSHGLVKNLIADGIREGSVFVKDPETGLTLKCRPDLISAKGFLVDYKSTLDASEDSFLYDIFSRRSYFYVLQAAHYVHCLKLAGIGRGDQATLIAIEKAAPWGVVVYPLDEGCLDVGEQWRAKLTRQYAECVSSGKWPGYREEAVPVTIPPYADFPPQY